jgi:Galactose oxidase-like, Early set domain
VGMTFSVNASGLQVKAPANGNLAPPGYYLLFILDEHGVPSVARFVHLGKGGEHEGGDDHGNHGHGDHEHDRK